MLHENWEDQGNFLKLRRIFFQNAQGEAFCVAYVDFILGLVATIILAMQMARTESFYPFILPPGLENEEAGTMPIRLIYMALYFTAAGLLICSICLFIGILLRRTCLITFWYCPNAIGILLHAIFIVSGSFADKFDYLFFIASFAVVRIFAVLKIYQFQKALKLHRTENKALDARIENSERVKSTGIYLNNNQNDAIAHETKVVSGAVFARIDETCQSPPGTASTDLNESTRSEYNGDAYNSEIYSHSKTRRGDVPE